MPLHQFFIILYPQNIKQLLKKKFHCRTTTATKISENSCKFFNICSYIQFSIRQLKRNEIYKLFLHRCTILSILQTFNIKITPGENTNISFIWVAFQYVLTSRNQKLQVHHQTRSLQPTNSQLKLTFYYSTACSPCFLYQIPFKS